MPHFSALAGVNPANIAISDISPKTTFYGTFLPQEVSVYLQPLLCNAHQKLPNSVKLRNAKGYYAVQGHSRSPILVPMEKPMRLPVSD